MVLKQTICATKLYCILQYCTVRIILAKFSKGSVYVSYFLHNVLYGFYELFSYLKKEFHVVFYIPTCWCFSELL